MQSAAGSRERAAGRPHHPGGARRAVCGARGPRGLPRNLIQHMARRCLPCARPCMRLACGRVCRVGAQKAQARAASGCSAAVLEKGSSTVRGCKGPCGRRAGPACIRGHLHELCVERRCMRGACQPRRRLQRALQRCQWGAKAAVLGQTAVTWPSLDAALSSDFAGACAGTHWLNRRPGHTHAGGAAVPNSAARPQQLQRRAESPRRCTARCGSTFPRCCCSKAALHVAVLSPAYFLLSLACTRPRWTAAQQHPGGFECGALGVPCLGGDPARPGRERDADYQEP